MRKQGCFDCSRRALLSASGASALLAALRPLRIFAQASGGKLRIGIIGSGHIGGAIGGLWVKAGHPVLFSSRHPEELKDLVAGLGPLAQNGTVSQAIAFGDALFFAVVCIENLIRFECLTESLNVSDHGRTVMLLSDAVGLAVQIE